MEETEETVVVEMHGAVTSVEVAIAEVARFAEAWDLDTDVERMDEEDRQTFLAGLRRLERKVMSGHLTVNDDGSELVYTLIHPIGRGDKPIISLKISIPTGSAMLAMDKHKDQRNIAKLNSFMGSMCKMSPALFGEPMSGVDVKVVQVIASLFLGS